MAAIAGIGARLTGNTAGWTAALNQAQQAGRAYVQATQAAMAQASGAVAAGARVSVGALAQQDAAMRRSAQVATDAARRQAAATRGFSSNGMGSGLPGAGGAGSGGGPNRGYQAGVAYNFVQDFAQAGWRGIANNVPQVIQMLGPLGVAIGALGGSLYALGTAVKYALGSSDSAADFTRRRQQEEARQIAVARQQRKEGISTGAAEGDAAAKERRDLISGVLEARAIAARKAATQKMLEEESAALERAALERMATDENGIKALAQYDLDRIEKTSQAAIAAAKKLADEEKAIQTKLLRDLEQLKGRAGALDNNRTKSDPAALREQQRVTRELAEVHKLVSESAARVAEAQAGLDAANANQQVGQIRKGGIVDSANAEISDIAKQEQEKRAKEAAEAAGNVFDKIRDGLKQLGDDAREATQRQGIQREQNAILREVAIQELRSKGDNKRADELEKAAMREQRIGQLKKANFSEAEAGAIADREAALSQKRTGTGKFGKRIKGAKSGNKESGLDGAFHSDAFDFAGFQAEGIPGFAEATTQRKKIEGAKQKKDTTAQPQEQKQSGTQRIEALLSDLISVTKGKKA